MPKINLKNYSQTTFLKMYQSEIPELSAGWSYLLLIDWKEMIWLLSFRPVSVNLLNALETNA